MAAKLPSSRVNKGTGPGSTAPPRAAVMGDNGADEAERIQLISFVSKLSGADEEIEVAKGPLAAARKKRKTIVGLLHAAGFTVEEINARMAEMNQPVRKFATQVARERKHRRWLGIIDADQEDMFTSDSAPQSAKDEVHWTAEGLKAGLRFQKAIAPPGITGLDLQSWLIGHQQGWDMATAATTANAPKKLEPTVREKAAADFAADNPEPEPGSPAAKKAERAAIAKAKASLDSMQGGDATADTVPAGTDDGFTLSDEELAAQAGRRQPEEADVV